MAICAALCGLLLAASPAHAASPFADWMALVVAGDDNGSGGGRTEAFDNARRDISRSLVKAGFQPANLRQFSVKPERYRDTRPGKSDLDGLYDAMVALTAQARSGCLVYLTSHGTPQGMVLDQRILAPGILAGMLDRTCAERPTVVVVSACFSGVFVPLLAGPNRMVLTAARRDRTSFGCGETDRYPYFDACFLSAMPGAPDLLNLAGAIRTCVGDRERAERVTPPSEPQLHVGTQLRPLLPLLGLAPARED